MLDKAGASLFISTYQSGRLIIARVIDGKLNTHFRAFASPMGIALTPQMMTLGTKNFVWHFRNHPGLAGKLDEGKVDAAYVPAPPTAPATSASTSSRTRPTSSSS